MNHRASRVKDVTPRAQAHRPKEHSNRASVAQPQAWTVSPGTHNASEDSTPGGYMTGMTRYRLSNHARGVFEANGSK